MDVGAEGGGGGRGDSTIANEKELSPPKIQQS